RKPGCAFSPEPAGRINCRASRRRERQRRKEGTEEMSNAQDPAVAAACNEVATLIGIGLKECGLAVSREAEGERFRELGPCLDIRGIPAAPVSSLLVMDGLTARWEYCPPDGGAQDPKRAADMITGLLTGQAAPYERLGGGYH